MLTFGLLGDGGAGGHAAWDGMVLLSTPSDNDALADAKGTRFDRSFVTLDLEYSKLKEYFSSQTSGRCGVACTIFSRLILISSI